MDDKEITMTGKLSFDQAPELLALRHSGTADVGLYWSRRAHRAAVAVEDDATGEWFEVPVEPGDNPLDLFDHPYAYAAGRHLRPDVPDG